MAAGDAICSIIQRFMSASIIGDNPSSPGYSRSVIDMPAECNKRKSSQTCSDG